MRSFHLVVAAFALLQLVRYARGALLFLVPRVRVSGEPGEAGGSSAGLRARQALEALGFEPLGVLRRRGPLGTLAGVDQTFASRDRGAYADVSATGHGPRVAFFSPFGDGGAVLTESVARRALQTASAVAVGLPGAPIEALLAAHQSAVARFRAQHGHPVVTGDLDGRVAAARSWYDGPGQRELRAGHAVAFGIALLSALVLASAVNLLLRGAR